MAVRTATAELTARERSEPRWSVRRVIPAFVWLWVVTRLLLLVISLNPRLYSSGVYGDVRAYGAKVERMFQGELPYRDVAIEYPPGSVPFTLVPALVRSEEHTSELQSRVDLVCRLLLEKKKK